MARRLPQLARLLAAGGITLHPFAPPPCLLQWCRGHAFLSLNEALLDRYAACDTAAAVIHAQGQHLAQLQVGGGPRRSLPAGMEAGDEDEERAGEEEDDGGYLQRGVLPPSGSEDEYGSEEEDAEASGAAAAAAAGAGAAQAGQEASYLPAGLLPPSDSEEEDYGSEAEEEEGQQQRNLGPGLHPHGTAAEEGRQQQGHNDPQSGAARAEMSLEGLKLG